MKLIADSGSTKTTWVLIENGVTKATVNTAGMNPYFHTSESFDAILNAELLPYIVPDHVREIHFYGAGCSTEKNDTLISEALQKYFHKAATFIYHDIMGAARALFGDRPGISCILGTGCNCCYYDGKKIFSRVESLGYLFGDEGAGSYLGKTFMAAYLKKNLPQDLRAEFDAKYNFTLEDILNSLYNRPYPNRFLASFSEFLVPRQNHPFLQRLISDSFLAFFNAQVKHYDNYRELPVSFVGSIAFFYEAILRQAAIDEGIIIETILQAPIEGLVKYHS
jgi:glucosamine kinase